MKKTLRLRFIMLLLPAVSCFLTCDLMLPPEKSMDDLPREITLFPVEDGMVSVGAPDWSGPTMTVSDINNICLLRFDLSEIPQDSTIIMARLLMKSGDVTSSGDLYCYPIAMDWDTSVTMDPANTNAFHDSATIFEGWIQDPEGDYRVFTWGFRRIVQAWVSGYPNRGIILKSGPTIIGIQLYTSESSNPPELFIRYKVNVSDEDD